jgi:hypothetical protein
VHLGIKSRVGMTGGSTRYRPLYEDCPNYDDRFEHHEHDYYSACAIPVKIGQWPSPMGFRLSEYGHTISSCWPVD